MCARSAVAHFERMRLYKIKKLDIERKHYFVVMNNVAKKLVLIIYALIKSGRTYDPLFLPADPRLRFPRTPN